MDAKTTDFHGEEGDYYEGDMIIQRRKVTAPDHYRWPNGSVPYEVEGSFSKQLCRKFIPCTFVPYWFSPFQPQVSWK